MGHRRLGRQRPVTIAAPHTTRRSRSCRRSAETTVPPSTSHRRPIQRGPSLPMSAATPRASGRDARDPSPAPPCRWPVTPCPRRPRTTHAARRSDPRSHSHALARRSRTAWCAARCAWLSCWGPRRVGRRRSSGRAPNSAAPSRCRGWSPMLRPACASRRRRVNHQRPPGVRR